MKPINKRIKALRSFLKFEQIPFANSVSLTQSQLSKIENGTQKEVPGESILAIISTYNVDANWLKGDIGYDDKPIFTKVVSDLDFEKTLKERDEFRDKLIKVQEELLSYQTQKITSLKNIENVSE